MADYQVTCIRRDGADADRRIDRLGGSWGSGSVDEVILWIRQGHTFWTMVQGKRANIVIDRRPYSGREYLRTESDSFPPNNLLNLPECPR